jgi:hypothetical protein
MNPFLHRPNDTRPQRGCWAPGHYMNHCLICGYIFSGDKRACWCADCAYGMTDADLGIGNPVEHAQPEHLDSP